MHPPSKSKAVNIRLFRPTGSALRRFRFDVQNTGVRQEAQSGLDRPDIQL